MGTVAIFGAGVMGETLLSGLLRAGRPADALLITERRPERAAELTEKYGVRVLEQRRGRRGGRHPRPRRQAAGHGRPPRGDRAARRAGQPRRQPRRRHHDGLRRVPAARGALGRPGDAEHPRARRPGHGRRVAAAPTARPSTWPRPRSCSRPPARCSRCPSSLQDAVTAISGSGPAYIFYVVEAMIEAGVVLGMPRSTATELVVQTLFGAATMIKETGQHPTVLREQVTSPGGTTAAALRDARRPQGAGRVHQRDGGRGHPQPRARRWLSRGSAPALRVERVTDATLAQLPRRPPRRAHRQPAGLLDDVRRGRDPQRRGVAGDRSPAGRWFWLAWDGDRPVGHRRAVARRGPARRRGAPRRDVGVGLRARGSGRPRRSSPPPLRARPTARAGPGHPRRGPREHPGPPLLPAPRASRPPARPARCRGTPPVSRSGWSATSGPTDRCHRAPVAGPPGFRGRVTCHERHHRASPRRGRLGASTARCGSPPSRSRRRRSSPRTPTRRPSRRSSGGPGWSAPPGCSPSATARRSASRASARSATDKPEAAQLFGLWVRPEARGGGVAAALVRAGARVAAEQGRSQLYYWVGTDNGRAVAFASGFGFRPTGEPPADARGLRGRRRGGDRDDPPALRRPGRHPRPLSPPALRPGREPLDERRRPADDERVVRRDLRRRHGVGEVLAGCLDADDGDAVLAADRALLEGEADASRSGGAS